MSFYLHKSISVGPFRFNLSGSGVGMSVGVKGLRVGTGPRGNYVRVGRGGVYYRHTFPPSQPSPDRSPQPSPQLRSGMQEIESGAASLIVDASSEDLLSELVAKKRKLALRPLAIVAAVLLVGYGLNTASAWAVLFLAIAGLALIVAAGHRDRMVKTTVILYDLESPAEEAFRRFTEWAQALAAAGRTWHVTASARVSNRKYHAGASDLVQRNVAVVRTSAPPLLKTNVPVLSIGAGRQTLYFLPDRMLVYDAAGIGAVSYRTLDAVASQTRFIESGGVPADATVVDRTWQYTNKKGGPDRRFSNNREIPICLYDELSLRTSTGLNELFQISRSGVAGGFVAAVHHLAGVTS